jgi:hypothetical protein
MIKRTAIAVMIAAACLAGTTVTSAHAATTAQPASSGSYISTYIADAYQDNYCLTYQGGSDPQDGDFAYMARCETTPTQVWLVYRNNDNVGFATPLAEPTPLALGQRGESSASIIIDYNKGTNYVLQLLYRGGDGHLWVLANTLYGNRWLGTAKAIRTATAQPHWVTSTRGVNVLLKFSNAHWKAD